MGRVQSIQVLRFIAASLVVLVHSNRVFAFGTAGVDIFFVISGFIIASIAKDKEPGEFLRDRFIRVYPIYLIASIPWLYYASTMPDWQRYAASLTLWPVYIEYVDPYLRTGWTLSFEMLFYLAAATLIWRPGWLRPMVITYFCLMVIAISTRLPLFRFVGNPIIIEFLFGAAIAQINRRAALLGLIALVASVGGWALSSPYVGEIWLMESVRDLTSPERVIVWGVPAALLVMAAVQLNAVIRGPIIDALAYLGDASYSIYLVHPFALIVLKLLMPWQLAFLCVIVVGVLQYRYIEQPLLKLLRGGFARPKPEAVPAE